MGGDLSSLLEFGDRHVVLFAHSRNHAQVAVGVAQVIFLHFFPLRVRNRRVGLRGGGEARAQYERRQGNCETSTQRRHADPFARVGIRVKPLFF